MNRKTMMNLTALTVEDLLEPAFDIGTSVAELDFTPDQLKAAADAWCWLLDLPATDEDARDEAMTDAPLLVALVVLSASEWLLWWQAMEWQHFPRSDGPQGERWAWAVGLKACDLMGWAGPVLAAQCSAADLVKRVAGAAAVQ